MFYSSYHKYVLSIFLGISVLLGIVLLIYSSDRTKDRPNDQIVMQASHLIERGDKERGLLLLQNLLKEQEHAGALKALALEYSNENSHHYDIRKALQYAERMLNVEPSEESRQFFTNIRVKALENW